MKKTFQIHLRIESDAIPQLKKEAEERRLSLSALCRDKLRTASKLDRMELILEKIVEKLKLNLREVK